MDRETFSNYGWLIVTVVVVALMIAFTGPFATYIKTSVQNVINGFNTDAKNAISAAKATGSTALTALTVG